MIRIAVSVLNFGAAESTLRCAESVLEAADASGRCSVELVVGDNGSDERDVCQLRDGLLQVPGFQLREYGENLGFSGGHNRNIEAILAGGRPDFIWLLNNDCIVEQGCLDALLDCARNHPQVGIFGATLLEPDGHTIQCAGGCFYNRWLSTYRPYGRGRPASERGGLRVTEFSYVAGASLFLPVGTLERGLSPPLRLLRAQITEGQGFLNESFFIYFEELDLAQRLKPGFSLGWCREALIIHAGGESTGAGGNRRSARAEYHSTLSALKFTRLYFPGHLWFMAPARYIAKNLQLLLTGNISLLGSVFSAYRDFWKWLHATSA